MNSAVLSLLFKMMEMPDKLSGVSESVRELYPLQWKFIFWKSVCLRIYLYWYCTTYFNSLVCPKSDATQRRKTTNFDNEIVTDKLTGGLTIGVTRWVPGTGQWSVVFGNL